MYWQRVSFNAEPACHEHAEQWTLAFARDDKAAWRSALGPPSAEGVLKLSQLGDAEQDTTLVTSLDPVDMIVLARAVPYGSHSLAAHFVCTVR